MATSTHSHEDFNMSRKHLSSFAATAAALGAAALTLLITPVAAQAGRGGSPQKIASAIRSGSVDAISAELERAEYLVCAACVDHVTPLVDHPDAKVRQVAAWWLSRRGVSRQVFTDMLWRLSQPDSVRARNAADVLGEFGAPQAIPALGAALSNPTFDPEARVSMARALGNIGRPAARPALEAVLTDASAPVRAAALGALRDLWVRGGVRDATPAMPLLADGDEAVRVQAVFLMARYRAQDAAAALASLVETDPSAGVRKQAAWALGEMGASSAIAGASLNKAARTDSSPVVRSLAGAALSRLSR